jgi:uncharacterized membrane protein YccC
MQPTPENPSLPADAPPPLSKSSRFNLKVMWNINRLSIAMFLGAIIYKTIVWLSR